MMKRTKKSLDPGTNYDIESDNIGDDDVIQLIQGEVNCGPGIKTPSGKKFYIKWNE